MLIVGVSTVLALAAATALAWFAERTDATLGPIANIKETELAA